MSINPEGFTPVGDTPREQRLRNNSAKRALKAGFLSLPTPENNFELLVPEEEDEEDARRLKKALARRSQAVQRGLPRPANVDVDRIGRVAGARRHRAPYPWDVARGRDALLVRNTRDEDVDAAKALIHLELASAVGFTNANPEQLREGLFALAKAETPDETISWAFTRQQLTYDAASKTWVEPASLSAESRVEGYTTLIEESREVMSKEAAKAAKAEKKLTVVLGGYLSRSQALSKRLTDAFDEMSKTKVDYESFSRLQTNESAVGPRRLEGLKEEVEKLERRETSPGTLL
ncbi:hypothetical protein FB451DRAFT_1470416 [Mycena latifolia]|nr:hypothetical protein FB451DRAFT_1470416 [Mycena latifolia]